MKLKRRKATAGILGIALICLAGVGLASGQTAPAAKPATPAVKQATPAEKVMAGTYFKDVEVLKDIPVDEFMDTMGFFAASLSLNCVDCHVAESGGSWARYADDTQLKTTARKMLKMVNTINQANFGGAKFVTCWTCHRGGQQPTTIPSLLEQYSAPPPDDPNEFTIRGTPLKSPTADEVFAKYIDALGGAQKLAALKSFVGKGTYSGFDTDFEKTPFDVYSKSPNLRAWVVHFRIGDGVHVYDGKSGYIASPDKPIPIMVLTDGALEGVKMDATVAFPAQLKATFPTWRVGATTIGDTQDVWVLLGSAPGRSTVKLYFDKKTNLLVRLARYENTVVGTNPIQVDYTDYRDVAGVKIPFQWKTTWTDGQDAIELSDVQANITIDATRFAKPAPAKIEGGEATGQ